MPEPLMLDILGLLLPLLLGALLFVIGRALRRLPRILQVTVVAMAVAVVGGGAASVSGVLPDEVNAFVSWTGGTTVLLSWAALLLLGIAWSAPGRRLSSDFLACLAAVAGCLLLIEASGPLWWRLGAPELWQRTPDAQGRLQQTSGMTCSPAAAAMLLHRYGVRAGEGEMAYLAGTSLFGTDAHGMARALNAKLRPHGRHARARHADYEECARREQPFVAHVRGQYLGHALLVERMSADMVDVVDPLDGASHALSRADFERIWDRTVLEVH